jgi:aspartate ammonia-lyase
MGAGVRIERDELGERELPAEALHGIHTLRALENFPLSGRPVPEALVRAYGVVKQACLRTAAEVGAFEGRPGVAAALEAACRELADGTLAGHVRVDALQGGAGTSTNMNVNEVLANRALQLLGAAPGAYHQVSPKDDVNRFQSTNDTYPTALRLAAVRGVRALEEEVVRLQDAFQGAEKRMAGVVKVARTEYQDAVLITLGREMSAYAEALSRDRWRLFKCEERLRVVNLGGTAVGTGLAAPRAYIFGVVDALRELSGVGFARADNLVEATQNADVFVEVMGMVKALATTLWKVANDLRLLSSGPEAGLGELRLPPRQEGSSIMPGKVNPVVPEAVVQAAMVVFGHEATLSMACAAGTLELNPFLPVVAVALLESLELLTRTCRMFREACVEGMEADEARCRAHLLASTAAATALLPALGHARAGEAAREARARGVPLRSVVVERGWMTAEAFDAAIAPEAVNKLGY